MFFIYTRLDDVLWNQMNLTIYKIHHKHTQMIASKSIKSICISFHFITWATDRIEGGHCRAVPAHLVFELNCALVSWAWASFGYGNLLLVVGYCIMLGYMLSIPWSDRFLCCGVDHESLSVEYAFPSGCQV